MDHPALKAAFAAIVREIESAPLALLNEGHLEVLAGDAAMRAGAAIYEGCNIPGKRWKISWDQGLLKTEAVSNPQSALGKQTTRGRPKGSNSPDLRLDLGLSELFQIEIKARCRFAASACNDSATLQKDFKGLKDRTRDALVLAIDSTVYANLLGDREGKRGQKGDQATKQGFSNVLPELGDLTGRFLKSVIVGAATWHLSISRLATPWGDRVLVVVALETPDWAA